MNNYTEISDYYDQIVEAGYYAMPKVAGEYKELLGPGVKNILEIGVGTGGLTLLLKDRYKITGIDFSAALLAKAKKKLEGYGVTLIQQDILDMNFNEQFDAAVSHASIFLIIESEEGTVVESFLTKEEEMRKALCNVLKAIKKGSKFIMDFHPEHTVGKRFMQLPGDRRYEFEIKQVNGMKEFYKLQQIKDQDGNLVAQSTDHKSRILLSEFDHLAREVGFVDVKVERMGENKYLILTK